MNKLVIYDSLYGNTEKIARIIGKSISAQIIRVTDINVSNINGIDTLIVGSPTQGGKATPAIQEFLNNIPSKTLINVKLAVFDTRFLEKNLNFALKLLVKTIGYAAPKMAKVLTDKGGKLIVPPEGFIVKGKEGPLASGELERAQAWAKMLK
ncbi:MAG: flavodoxin family protein [Actinobacteria bacterium]|nr:flavodoxin family protein [Actinomycetota bacterium]